MKWVRLQTIGHGSFSTVSLATTGTPLGNSSPSCPPAIAVKSSGTACSATLQYEKQVLDSLGDCPEIVRCFGDDRTVENGEQIYNLLLEYAPCGNLVDRIRKSGSDGRLPEFHVRKFTRCIVKGLRHIHAHGFSHCDIKPENILIFSDTEAKISDFGLAKKTENETRNVAKEKGFEIRGTPLYTAPESVNDGDFGSPADIWALGCTVVKMASGKPAWRVDEQTNIMSLLVRIGVGVEQPRIPSELSEEGRDFLGKCFVRNPEKRWTAEMLLNHPFMTVDEKESTAEVSCSSEEEEEEEEEDASDSPRRPFDFPDWIPVLAPAIDPATVHSSVSNSSFNSSVTSPAERIRGLFTHEAPDWSVSCDWVNVR